MVEMYRTEQWVHLRSSDDWEALYVNGNKLQENHSIDVIDCCLCLEDVITNGFYFTHDYVDWDYISNEEFTEDILFPEKLDKDDIDRFDYYENNTEDPTEDHELPF